MTPLVLGLGVPELLIILAVVLLLFGGSRLAGIGKSSGRAIREFKEETRSLDNDKKSGATATNTGTTATQPETTVQRETVVQREAGSVEAERRTDDLR